MAHQFSNGTTFADAQEIARLRQEVEDLKKLLRSQTQSIERAIAHLDNDLYATRVVACRSYLEGALDETKDDYGWEASQ